MSTQFKLPVSDYLPDAPRPKAEPKPELRLVTNTATVENTTAIVESALTVVEDSAATIDPAARTTFEYTEADGKPMAASTDHAATMILLYSNLQEMFPDNFVGIDLFWYPRPNESISFAPDVFVVFGVPATNLKSYVQAEHGNIPPHVIFEVLSASNDAEEMRSKFQNYQKYGVKEYYVYDPVAQSMQGYVRNETGNLLLEIPAVAMQNWQSPLLKMFMRLEGGEWKFYYPDGKPFRRYRELSADEKKQTERAEAAEAAKAAALQQAAIERRQREAERQRAEAAETREAAAEAKLAEMAAKLRAMGLNPDDMP